MRSKNSAALTVREREHVAMVKELDCSVCDQPGPSDAHHIQQGDHWTVIAVCFDCHRSYNGWHGTKALWKVRKMDELKALSVTIRRLHGGEGFSRGSF